MTKTVTVTKSSNSQGATVYIARQGNTRASVKKDYALSEEANRARAVEALEARQGNKAQKRWEEIRDELAAQAAAPRF